VVAANSSDLLASTYSGKVLCFTHELKHSSVSHIAPKLSNLRESGPPAPSASTSVGLPGTISNPDGSSTNVMVESSSELEKSIRELKMELEKLTERVAREKEKYASKVSSELIAVEQQFKLKQSFALLPAEACYLLTIEIDMPLDCVTLQSNIPVMLLDVDSNGALVSRTERDEKQGNELLANYRTTEPTNRIEIKVRTVEGQHGVLNAYIMPKLAPKTCQRAELRIKPLSLHEKVYKEAIAAELASRPLSTLTLTGAFSLPDVHAWVQLCLPDVSAKLAPSSGGDAAGGTQILYFKSTFLQTILTVEYSKGRCVFRSDSLTSISIVKEVLTKEATSKKISIHVELDLSLPSIKHFLTLLRPELDAHFTLAKRHALIAPLKEIATHEMGLAGAGPGVGGGPPGGAATGGTAASASSGGILAHLDELSRFLQPSYISILRDSDAIESKLKSAPRHLDFLRGIVTDLFVDMHKLQGRSAQARVPQLLAILEDYNFDKLLAAFEGRS
jgi:Bardet-Biedl syndrome 7 protein